MTPHLATSPAKPTTPSTTHTTVAIQGIRGAFHDEAAQKLVPGSTPVECATFHEVFETLKSGKSDYGIVAIENSLHGSINPVYRLLERNSVWIAGETTLHVNQYLIGPQPISLTELNTAHAVVSSQAPPLAQCELWLTKNLPHAERRETGDTATSVRDSVAERNPRHVAIAGKQAAEIYGGIIIAGPINDDPHNYTRFVLIQREQIEVADANRTSVILVVGHREGALFEALSAFAEEKINLSKLDSHPIPSDTRHYAFYIDLDAGMNEANVQRAFKKLESQGCTIKVLGSYRVG